MRDLLKSIFSFRMEYLAKGVKRRSACVNTCLGQEGSCFASRVEDTKVPVNSAKQWHRTGVKLEDSPKALGFTALGGCGHFSNNTFPTLTSSYYKSSYYKVATRLPVSRMVFTQLQTTTFIQFLSTAPSEHCHNNSSNNNTSTGLQVQ